MKTEILPVSEQSLALARDVILAGDLVAFHTETVYGLGANAFCDCAVKKVFEVKGRPQDNPLISHVHTGYDITPLIDGEPRYASALRKAFLPGPLTMVYPSTGKVSKFVSCGLNTLSVRVPSSATAQAFLKAVNLPIVAPSANLSKHVSPVSAQHVYDDFCGKIPLILDGGRCEGGIESTVLDCTGEIPQVLRTGLITREQIACVAGDCALYSFKQGEKPKSPGMLYKHYSPRCKTAYCTTLKEAILLYQEEERRGGVPYLLCENGVKKEGFRALLLGSTAEEMAASLYARLREGEQKATLIIAVQPTLQGGVMDGVMNRLTRACRGD